MPDARQGREHLRENTLESKPPKFPGLSVPAEVSLRGGEGKAVLEKFPEKLIAKSADSWELHIFLKKGCIQKNAKINLTRERTVPVPPSSRGPVPSVGLGTAWEAESRSNSTPPLRGSGGRLGLVSSLPGRALPSLPPGSRQGAPSLLGWGGGLLTNETAKA